MQDGIGHALAGLDTFLRAPHISHDLAPSGRRGGSQRFDPSNPASIARDDHGLALLKVVQDRSRLLMDRHRRSRVCRKVSSCVNWAGIAQQGRPEFSTGSASLLAPGGFCSRLCPGKSADGDRMAAGSAPLPSGSRVELGARRNGNLCCCSCWSGCCCCGSPPGSSRQRRPRPPIVPPPAPPGSPPTAPETPGNPPCRACPSPLSRTPAAGFPPPQSAPSVVRVVSSRHRVVRWQYKHFQLHILRTDSHRSAHILVRFLRRPAHGCGQKCPRSAISYEWTLIGARIFLSASHAGARTVADKNVRAPQKLTNGLS